MNEQETDTGETRNARPARAASAPDDASPFYGKSWAVVIGIDDYTGGLPELENAVNDAREVARLLREQYDFAEVHTLLDKEATRGNILSWLRDHLATDTGPDDRVIVFFAGHGVTQTLSRDRVRGYLVPYDAQVNRYADYIDMQELNQACGMMPAKHVLLVLDCCFSGVAAVASRSVPVAPPRLDDVYLQSITSEPAWQVLTAGRSDEPIADSGARPGHSAFTAALLDGLEGAADANQDGLVTAGELATYVSTRVTRETKAPGTEGQTPFFNYLAGSGQGDQVFVLPGWTPPAKLALKLSPQVLEEGRAELTVDNEGGEEVEVRLEAADARGALWLELDPDELILPPGSSESASLTAQPGKKRPWLGLRQEVPFTVAATAAGQRVEQQGAMRLSPRLPPWAQAAIGVALLAAIVLAIVLWPREVRVPDVRGLHVAAARATVTDRGLVVDSTRDTLTDINSVGYVFRSDPAAETVMTPESTVVLVVGALPTPTDLPTARPRPTHTRQPLATATPTRPPSSGTPGPTSSPTPTHTPPPGAECLKGPDLRIDAVIISPEVLISGQAFEVSVWIHNVGIPVAADTWTYLYLDRAAQGLPDQRERSLTSGLSGADRAMTRFALAGAYAQPGWHTVSIVIDGRNEFDETACSGEGNNSLQTKFQVLVPTPTGTAKWEDFLGHWMNENPEAVEVANVVISKKGIELLGRASYSVDVYDWPSSPRIAIAFQNQVWWGTLEPFLLGDALYASQTFEDEGVALSARSIRLRREGDQLLAEVLYDYADDNLDLGVKHVLNQAKLPGPTPGPQPPRLLVLPTQGVVKLPTPTPTAEG